MQKHSPNNRCAHARGKQASVKLNTSTCSHLIFAASLGTIEAANIWPRWKANYLWRRKSLFNQCNTVQFALIYHYRLK